MNDAPAPGYADILANVKAIETLLMALLTERMTMSSTPQKAAFNTVEGAIAALHTSDQSTDPAARQFFQMIEDELRRMLHNLQGRLAAAGHTN